MLFQYRRSLGGFALGCVMALAGLLALSFYTLVERVPTPVVAIDQPQTLPTPPCLSQEPPFFRHTLPTVPKDKQWYVPGAAYKESKNAFGSSAVPPDIGSLSYAEAFAKVKQTFYNHHCGVDGLYGGDPTLHKVLMLPHSPLLRVNDIKGWHNWEAQARDLDYYLSAIDWERSYLVKTTLPQGSWTLAARAQPGTDEPQVVAVENVERESWYLVLAINLSDGTTAWEWRRLECDFQTSYFKKGDVPVGVLPL